MTKKWQPCPALPACTPLTPKHAAAGCQEVLETAKRYLCEITGMADMTFQPAAGAHGEFTGVLLIKQYHEARGDHRRTKIIVPDSAHGTNPATAAMCGYQVVNIPSAPQRLRGFGGPSEGPGGMTLPV